MAAITKPNMAIVTKAAGTYFVHFPVDDTVEKIAFIGRKGIASADFDPTTVPETEFVLAAGDGSSNNPEAATTTGGVKVELTTNDTTQVAHEAEATNGIKITRDPSPAPSTATTDTDASGTPLSWTDVQRLEDFLGREVANELIARFPPNEELTPRAMMKTFPIVSNGMRYGVHEILGRVWGDKLNHETEAKSHAMHIWVPGSTVPRWLTSLHQSRQNRRKQAPRSSNTVPRKPTYIEKKPEFDQKLPAFKQPSALTADRPVKAVWTSFATNESTRMQNGIDAYNAKRDEMIAKEKAAKEAAKLAGESKPVHILNQVHDIKHNPIKPKEPVKESEAEPTKDTDVAPKKSALPPHLRAKAVDTTTKTNDENTA